MKALFAASLLNAATASHAQDLPNMGEFLANLDGTEVAARADIGYLRGADLTLRLDGMYHGISAQAALPRDQLASIEGCNARDYETKCTADILAELKFSGGRIFATIFDVQNVTRGE